MNFLQFIIHLIKYLLFEYIQMYCTMIQRIILYNNINKESKNRTRTVAKKEDNKIHNNRLI